MSSKGEWRRKTAERKMDRRKWSADDIDTMCVVNKRKIYLLQDGRWKSSEGNGAKKTQVADTVCCNIYVYVNNGDCSYKIGAQKGRKEMEMETWSDNTHAVSLLWRNFVS